MIKVNVKCALMGVASSKGRVTLRQGINVVTNEEVEKFLLESIKKGAKNVELLSEEPVTKVEAKKEKFIPRLEKKKVETRD